jgi:hypothetical protein
VLAKDTLRHAVVCGALFGFFTCATHDLTNLALFKDLPLNVVIVDIVWGGGFLFSRCIAEFGCCQMDTLMWRIRLKKSHKKTVDNDRRVSNFSLNKV